MKTHISKTVSSCFAALRRLRSIRRSVSQAVLLSLVTSLIMTQLDYGSAVLAGLPSHLLNRLQSERVSRSHVRPRHSFASGPALVTSSGKNPVSTCRSCFLLSQVPNHKAPSYLADDLHWTDEAESRHRLRSGSCPRLIVPPTSSNSAQHHWRSIISCDCRTCMEQS